MILNMSIQYLITLGVDIGVIILLLAVFYRTGRSKYTARQIDSVQIKSLENSLKNLMSESTKNSNELISRLDDKMNDLNLVLNKIDEKELSLKKYIRQAQELQTILNETKQERKATVSFDPYQKAAELIDQGCTREDVQKECGLSINEIDLIKQLVRYRSH
jgi:hypothetical protein